MSRFTGNRCQICGKPTDKPRRGLCFACYQRQRRGHQLAGPCAICGLEDKRLLRRHQLADGLVVLCANHAALAGRRQLSLDELAAECHPPGDRRSADRRRGDRRNHIERRQHWDAGWTLQDRRQHGRRAADG